MNSMNGIQEVLRHSLLEINNQCQSLRQGIAVFVNSVSTLPAAMVKERLSAMFLQIKTQILRNEEKGVVFVMMSDTVLSVQWAEKELSIKGKEDLKREGYLTLSPEVITKMMEYLADRIDSGQLAEAVEWINQYEPFLALEAKKLP